MRDDDAAGVPSKGARTPDAQRLRDAVALPEHASAYYSPRPPPATTAHDTIESEAVRLDPGIDPGLELSERITEDEIEPPRSIDPRAGADAPTLLVPIVRARRRRRRVFAIVAATLVGSLAGIGFGLMRGTSVPTSTDASRGAIETPTSRPSAPSVAVVATAKPHPAPASSAAIGVATSGLAETGVSSDPIGASPVVLGRRHLPSAQRRESSASSAWFKPEPPKAWIK